ncbi:MAG: hypothetical protein PHS41_04500, partial [Victivallaceae bacterium]|nr:hypothetical protein [Victivallaceae bacterium]
SMPFAERVRDCIATHRYRRGQMPDSLEGKILFDADKLDSLGAAGIGRAFLFAGAARARLHNTREEALSHAEYSREDTAYREYLVKLSKLPAGMLTGEGRRLARRRARFMEQFFEELNRECGQAAALYAAGAPQ